MIDDLIAIAALADIVLTAFLMIRFRRNPFPWLRLLSGAIICAIITSLFFGAYITRWRGAPVNLFFITMLCLSVSALVPLNRPAWSLALLAFTLVMAVGLPWFANHQQDYTFFPRARIQRSDRLYDYLADLPHQEKSFSVGWLADQPFAADIPQNSMQGRLYIPHPLWHSRFSGMYRLEVIEGEAWYPGGPLKDGRRKIEIRER